MKKVGKKKDTLKEAHTSKSFLATNRAENHDVDHEKKKVEKSDSNNNNNNNTSKSKRRKKTWEDMARFARITFNPSKPTNASESSTADTSALSSYALSITDNKTKKKKKGRVQNYLKIPHKVNMAVLDYSLHEGTHVADDMHGDHRQAH